MNLQKQLFESERLRLAPIDPEADAEIEAAWSQDGSYLRMLDLEPAWPLSPALVKKRYAEIEKEADKKETLIYFTIRLRPDDRLIGFARLYSIQWPLRYGRIQLGIGQACYRGKGYGSEALELLLGYAFTEVNLYSLGVGVPEYNPTALRLFEKAGFIEEACFRKALYRQGRRWDMMLMSLLEEEWRSQHG